MTKKDLIDKAIYIQFPYSYTTYKEYKVDKEINKLPLPEKGMMYDGWTKNNNHYTPQYHRKYTIPLLCKILNINFNNDDFVVDERHSGNFDISLLKPKEKYEYEIYGYTRGEHFDNLLFEDITSNDSPNKDITDYHRLYKYSHECSRLINKTINSDRILFISGDSQLIPIVPFLSSFFKEIWYFDNRDNKAFSDKWGNIRFTDVIIEMNWTETWTYLDRNFKEIENNVNIFIGTQKTFEPKVTNEVYKIIVGNHDIENNSNLELIQCKHDLPLDDRFYSEIYMLDYIAKNRELKKYVGFCHNRRYFSFLDKIPNIDEIFSEFDCITAKPKQFKSNIIAQYKSCHNIEDLYIIGGIIADKYPQYAKMWHTFINGKIFIPYNMFIMKSEDFIEYMKFIMGVLDEYVKIVGTDINKRIEDNKDKYLKSFYPNNTQEYQYRIGGYAAERLSNLFILTHFKKIKTYPVIVTENKYQNEKSNL